MDSKSYIAPASIIYQLILDGSPENTRHCTNVGTMLARRLRRRPNIETTLVQCLVFAGIYVRYLLSG